MDIICFKWLKAACSLIYVELLYSFVEGMVPFEQGKGYGQAHLVLSLFSALGFSCDPLPNFIILAIYVLQLTCIQLPQVWGFELDAHYLFESACLVSLTLIMFLLVSILITKLAQTRNLASLRQKSDFHLLNCVSESVIVFESHSKNIVRFASDSLLKILSDQPHFHQEASPRSEPDFEMILSEP